MDATIGELKEALQKKRDLDKAIARSENENTQGLDAQIIQKSLEILHRKPTKFAQNLMREMGARSLMGEQCDEEDLRGLVLQFRQSKPGQQSEKQMGQLDKLLKARAESGEDTHVLAHSPAHSKRRDHLYKELARIVKRIVILYGRLLQAATLRLLSPVAEWMNLPTKTAKQMGRRNAEVGREARVWAEEQVRRQMEEAGIDESDIMDVEIAWRRRTLTAVTAVREASIATAHRADR